MTIKYDYNVLIILMIDVIENLTVEDPLRKCLLNSLCLYIWLDTTNVYKIYNGDVVILHLRIIPICIEIKD